MLLSYEQFKEILNRRIKNGNDFYLELLETVIDNPNRYCGLFRLTNAKTKLIQNTTQSQEIKFGDFMEEIATLYIGLLGYDNLNKDLGYDENGDRLNADQVFTDGEKIYLVEQKVRDDHDSTKKRGQFANFIKKVNLLQKKYPNKPLVSIMWFIDNGLTKNKNYYQQEMDKLTYDDVDVYLYYGGAFFETLNNGSNVWDEIIDYLSRNRLESSREVLTIPNFGTSEDIYNALLKLPSKYWLKLLSTEDNYRLLRKELFSDGDNLDKAKKALGYH